MVDSSSTLRSSLNCLIVHDAVTRWTALTDREKAVLALMAQGRSNHAIANRLFVTEKTVEAHIRAIFIKLNLSPTADDHRRVLAVITYLWDE
jgi:DNA-binding NarL/FixJ family response regulator